MGDIGSSKDFLCLKRQSTDRVKPGTMFTPSVPSQRVGGIQNGLWALWQQPGGLLMSEGSLGNSMPSWKDPAQSFRGTGSCRTDTRVCLESLEHQKIHHIGGCAFFPLEQDRTSTGNPGKTWDSHFTTNSGQEESTNRRWDPVCCVLEKLGKGLFFFQLI